MGWLQKSDMKLTSAKVEVEAEPSKNLARGVKELKYHNPLVQELAEEASLDLEYLDMLNCIENKVENKDLPQEFALWVLTGCRDL